MDNMLSSIAIFGCTGGCGKAALVESLKAGHTVRALVRSPNKLGLDKVCLLFFKIIFKNI